ncbi:MAG: lipopolysaccharide biosynthesis protein [Prevotella sp.]|nr:lipopolysaccharide biosynthesis protein [Prevotella sp.]
MPTTSDNNKRIAKNTLMLYFRMLVMMAVSLYTSRVVLDTLGVSDYGIYNVVGGFVTMFALISGAMTTATQRFLSFAIGEGKTDEVTSLFSTAVIIHIGLALIILLLGETVGVWFVSTQMNFPAGRYNAAIWVFEFSLLTFLVSVINVPYNAAIIAYEKMSAFAYISIIEVVLKLVIVYLLLITPFDRLIFYAIVMAIVQLGVQMIYASYTHRKIKTCHCNWRLNHQYFKQMTSFVSWNLIGSLAGICKDQGLNVVLNIFFGTTVNAARGVAMQVSGAINRFVTNFQVAMNPQIVKLYAAEEKKEMFKLVFRGSRFSYMLLLCLSLPVIIEAPFILNVWLVKVPDYSVPFLRLIIFIALVDSLSNTLITSMHASGKVRDYQIVVGGLSLLTLPLAYVLLKVGLSPTYAVAASLFISTLCLFARCALLSHTIDFPASDFLKQVALRMLLITMAAYILPLILYNLIPVNWPTFILVCLVSFLSGVIMSYYFGMQKHERDVIVSKLKDKIHKS